ncbi:MAG: ABC-2 transporter permease [Ruminococcus sp.]|nr:ABC-2 transporter permease [Ruminococcus sp.]
MKRIIDLMRLDIIAMRAKKLSLWKLFAAVTVLALILGLVSPIFLYFLLFAVAFTAAQAIIDLSNKNEGEMTYAVIPAARKQVVIARYALVMLVLTAVGALSLIILQIRFAMNVNLFLDDSLSEVLNIKMNDGGLCTVILCLFFAVALIFNANVLSGFFKTGKTGAKGSMFRAYLLILAVWAGLAVLLVVESTLSVKPLHAALQVLMTTLSALSVPYNGALLCIFAIVGAYGYVIYKAACSVIDYEEREL